MVAAVYLWMCLLVLCKVAFRMLQGDELERERERHRSNVGSGVIKNAELLIAQESKLCSHV